LILKFSAKESIISTVRTLGKGIFLARVMEEATGRITQVNNPKQFQLHLKRSDSPTLMRSELLLVFKSSIETI
jgi:hypothetical protein